MPFATPTAVALWVVLFTARATASRIALALPATALHELSHWVLALVTGSRPGLPSLWPRKEGDHWVLGSVAFIPGMWTAALVALAPILVLAPLAAWGLCYRIPGKWTTEIGAGLFFGYAAWGCLPSTTDVAVALKHPGGLLWLGGAILPLWWLYVF